MLNPYSQTSMVKFIITFFQRLGLLLSGQTELATDELQILILATIAASSAMVGVFLIYRKMTMQANALSHSVLFGIVLTYLILKSAAAPFDISKSFQTLFVTALVTGIVTAVLTHLVIKISKLQRDAAIGFVFTTLFALGILLISIFSRNTHIGVELVTGNVDALHIRDLPGVATIFGIDLALVLFFLGGLKTTTFDPIYSYLRGLSRSFYHYLMIFLLSMTAIGSFRAVGVVLVLSFFLIPPLIARPYSRSVLGQIILSMAIGALASLLGVALTRHLLTTYAVALSTGGVTVLTLYGLLALNFAILRLKKVLNRLKSIEQRREIIARSS